VGAGSAIELSVKWKVSEGPQPHLDQAVTLGKSGLIWKLRKRPGKGLDSNATDPSGYCLCMNLSNVRVASSTPYCKLTLSGAPRGALAVVSAPSRRSQTLGKLLEPIETVPSELLTIVRLEFDA
jgi:hypothetical protein